MFCPSCRTEYREGFYTCADCSVPLVPELPKDVPSCEKTPRLSLIYRRVLNFYLDQFVILLTLLPVLPRISKWVVVGTTLDSPRSLLVSVLMSIYWMLYYFFFEFYFGRTPAKYITGTMVVSADGKKVSPKRIAIRTLSRLIPMEPFFSYREGTWGHDRLSKTKVIVARHRDLEAPPAGADDTALSRS